MKNIALVLLLLINGNSSHSQCWRSVSAGSISNLAIKSDGSLWVWGDNQYGNFGNGSTTGSNIPIQLGTERDFMSLSAGKYGIAFSLGIKTDGTLWAWGNNNFGQLGDGTRANRIVPVQIGNENNWSTVDAGSEHSVALKNNGTIWAWGNNNAGQLGDGTYILKKTPIQIGVDTDWVMANAGGGRTFAMKRNGTIWTCGIGSGSSLLVQVGEDSGWKEFSAGLTHTLALKSDGSLWAWGDNTNGALGIGGGPTWEHTPIQVGTDTNWQFISAGRLCSHAIKTDGSLWGWGRNEEFQLGNNDSLLYVTTPVQIGVSTNWIFVSSGGDHIAAFQSDSSLWVWGDNSFGQLGDGIPMHRREPEKINCLTTTAVKWLYFHTSLQQNDILLKWAITPGSSVDKFEIQRSADGRNFTKRSVIQSRNMIENVFTYLDSAPQNGYNYYRLKSIDLDNHADYSNISQILYNPFESHLSLYPNPVKDILMLTNAMKGPKIEISLYNFTGQKILETSRANTSQFQIPVSTLATGMYTVVITDGMEVMTGKFIKE